MKKIIELLIFIPLLVSCVNYSQDYINLDYETYDELNYPLVMESIESSISPTDESITVTITNNTSYEALTGYHYTIERYEGDNNWATVPLSFFVHDIGISIMPNESLDFNIDLHKDQYDYKNNTRYRVVKDVSLRTGETYLLSDNETQTLTTEFIIN